MEDAFRWEVPHLKDWRLSRGWTLQELGERSGVHWVSVWRLEKQQRKAQAKTLHKLAKAFGVSPHQLLDAPSEAETKEDGS